MKNIITEYYQKSLKIPLIITIFVILVPVTSYLITKRRWIFGMKKENKKIRQEESRIFQDIFKLEALYICR